MTYHANVLPPFRTASILLSSQFPVMPLRAVLCLRGASHPHTPSPPTRTSVNPHPLSTLTLCQPSPSVNSHPLSTLTLCQPSPYRSCMLSSTSPHRFPMPSSTFAFCLACCATSCRPMPPWGIPPTNPTKHSTLVNATLTNNDGLVNFLLPSIRVHVCFSQNVHESIEPRRLPSCNTPRSLSAHW
jgi:hypothetical protein